MDYQSTAGKMAADFMQRSSKELEECGRIFDRMFPDPCPYFAMGEWAAMITAAPVGTPLTINNKPAPPSPRPMINWEILAETYAIGLREAKAKIVALEAEVALVKAGMAAEFEKRKADRVKLAKANADFFANTLTLRPGTSDGNVNCVVPFSTWEALVEAYRDEVARLTPPAPQPERTPSDVLARCMKADRMLDAYGR